MAEAEGLDVARATKEQLEEYMMAKIKEYQDQGHHGNDLWMEFVYDFENFTTETFTKTGRSPTLALKKLLLTGGVYVEPHDKNLTIAKTLFKCHQEEIFHIWTPEELKWAAYSGLDFFSKHIQREVKAIHVVLGSTALNTPQPSTSLTRSASPVPSIGLASPKPIELELRERTVVPTATPAATPTATSTATATYGREIANLSKMYTDELKYSGNGDSLRYKLTIFYDMCSRADVPPSAHLKALPTMLKGLALTRFFNAKASGLNCDTMDNAIRNLEKFFEGPGFQRRAQSEWDSITLNGIIATNSGQSTSTCLTLLVDKLQQIQHGLPIPMQDQAILHNKLITACSGVTACRYAIADPPDGVGALINKLQSSVLAFEKETPANQSFLTTGSESLFTDRKFRSNGDNWNRSHLTGRSSNRTGTGKCFVCNKPDCRSWKHTEKEREESINRFKSKLCPESARGNRFQKRIRQYILEYEAEDNDYDSGLDEAFNSVVIDDDDEPVGTTTMFFTSLGSYDGSTATTMVAELANRALNHALCPQTKPVDDRSPETFVVRDKSNLRYGSSKFIGIVIDTGAAKHSTAGHKQFLALQTTNRAKYRLDESTKGTVRVQFGIGSGSSIGSVSVDTPIGQVEFHVLKTDTPFLLSLADLDRLKFFYNNLDNELVSKTSSLKIPIIRRSGHPFMMWDTSPQALIQSFDYESCFLTEIELRRLHRRFGHPSVNRLRQLLERSGHESNAEALQELTKACHYCQLHGKSPGRFKFTLKDDVNFNYCVYVDVMYIDGQPLLHLVDEATRFQAGKWLQNISSKHTWDVLRTCWIDTYLGPPDVIAHDAGKNFIGAEFRQYAINVGTMTKTIPVEAHNSVGLVERYHGPLRRAYKIISAEVPGIDKDLALQMAFKAVNDSAGPNGLVPTLLVFGAYPRMTVTDAPSPTVNQRAIALKKAMDEIAKLRAERQVTEALAMRNGPDTTAIHDLPLQSHVLVWREGNTGQPGSWTGPYTLLSVDGETCVVELPNGPTSFRSTVVKPYIAEPREPLETEALDPESEATKDRLPERPLKLPPERRKRGRPRKHPVATNVADVTLFLQDSPFQDSRLQEIAGLAEKDVFKVTRLRDVPLGTRIFGARFVDEIKYPGTERAYEKSRLVVQAYNDDQKTTVLTQSPTIQRMSQRLILCLAVLGLEDCKLYIRDITQAYVQSLTELNRNFYVKPPQEVIDYYGIDNNSVLKVTKPLYGVPEAGNHWFKTYFNHHIESLGMEPSTYDPCLLWTNGETAKGIVGLQTDDTLIYGNNAFAQSEEDELRKAKFSAKAREQLTVDKPIKFNGCTIQLLPTGEITVTQENQCQNLSVIDKKPASTRSARGHVRQNLTTEEQYAAQRARAAYIASCCQPEAAFDLSVAAQVTKTDKTDVTALNKRIQWQKENSSKGLKFVKLDHKTLQISVFTDASFANNKDMSSQVGYVIVLADATGKANIIHWSSTKCKRITRSVLASELYAMAYGFDIATALKGTIDQILQTQVPLILYTDSKSLYDCLVKLGTTTEKRLMIDVMCLRQAYERRQIMEVKWVDGNSNPADSMTKGTKNNQALARLVDSNKLELKQVQWVERAEL